MGPAGQHMGRGISPVTVTEQSARSRLSLAQTFAALKYPNYRLWFFGQMVSLFGTWMQSTAQGYLIFELTHSPAFLGYVSFASGVPIWLFMLYGGVVADRVPRRTLLVITQAVMMTLAFVLAALSFAHLVQPWHIIVLSFMLGTANAFDAPARQAFVLEMVEREDLTNAIALNSTMFNTATALGPAAAGFVYALAGPSWCFTLNGVSFIAIILGLLAMRLKPMPRREQHASAFVELKEGLRYVAKHETIRALIATVCAINLFAGSFGTLLPAWAVNVLHGDARTNGFLQSARAVGALMSALTIASLGRFKFRGQLLTMGSLAFPIALLTFSAMRWVPLSLLLLAATGAASMFIMNMANSLMQTQADDKYRGRVMSAYALVFFGMMPLGGLMAGAVAESIGEPTTVALFAAITLAWSVFILLAIPRVRKLT